MAHTGPYAFIWYEDGDRRDTRRLEHLRKLKVDADARNVTVGHLVDQD